MGLVQVLSVMAVGFVLCWFLHKDIVKQAFYEKLSKLEE